jgi:hypothetical protein
LNQNGREHDLAASVPEAPRGLAAPPAKQSPRSRHIRLLAFDQVDDAVDQ